MNLDNIGISTIKDSTAFKKIQFFSKTNPTNLFNVKSDFQNSFNKLSSYYFNDLDLNQSYTYGMDRQHVYTSLSSSLPMFASLLDTNSTEKFFSYNLNSKKTPTSALNLNRLNYNNLVLNESLLVNFTKLLPSSFTKLNPIDFSLFLQVPNTTSVLNTENDAKQYSNDFKLTLSSKHKKKTINNFDFLMSNNNLNSVDMQNLQPNSNFTSTLFNLESNLKFKDYKSSNAQFLGSERTVRLLNNLNSSSYKWNISASPNKVTTVTNNLLSHGNTQNYVYASSLSNWADFDKYTRFANNNI
jgi:hypothetical protein